MKQDREYYLEKLNRWDILYYLYGNSDVSDTEYDLFRTEFKNEYPDDEYFSKVGTPINLKYEEIEIPFIMGGLDKVDSYTVESWIKKGNGDDIHFSEKLDGNSIACIWENGKLIYAVSRGDGETGQNILQKAKYFIPNIPENSGRVILRGEVLLEGETYKDLGFKNRRNGVAGLLRRDDVIPDHLKKLRAKFYEVIESPFKFQTQSERMCFIESLKLEVPFSDTIPSNTDNIVNFLEETLMELKEKALYDIDGLVLSFSHSERENVKYPKNKVKFKVNEEAVRCKVIGIEWNVTRTGFVKPVVLIEPTEIMGVTVSRASGFNYEFIMSHNIGVDSEVGIVRSGDVIPYITEVFVEVNPVIPEICPCCGFSLIGTEKELKCNNISCRQKNIYIISHFFIEMGCDNITDRTIEMIGVQSIEEMYELSIEDLEKLPGFGRKKAEMIINEVNKTLSVKPEKLLAAFGIPSIGTTISRSLCSRFSFDDLFNIENFDKLELGPITTNIFSENIGKYEPLYKYLKTKGLKFIEEDKSLKTLMGKKFALTGAGKLKRKEYISMAESKGGIVGSISKDTNYLVCDDISTDSDKIKKAKKLGTEIITYEQFEEMLK